MVTTGLLHDADVAPAVHAGEGPPLLVVEIGDALHLLGDGSPGVVAVHHGDAQPRPGDEGIGGAIGPQFDGHDGSDLHPHVLFQLPHRHLHGPVTQSVHQAQTGDRRLCLR